jgi:hypothetical protein
VAKLSPPWRQGRSRAVAVLELDLKLGSLVVKDDVLFGGLVLAYRG